MRTSEPRELNSLLDELREALTNCPLHTCERCGERFGPMAAPLCWRCDEDERRAAERRRRALEDLAAVDKRFQRVTLANYDCPPGDAEALAAVQAWDARQGRGLLLFGNPGGGKSHLAFAVAKACIDDGLRVFATDWTDLLQRIRATYSDRPGAESASDIHARIDRADVVLIDDLGAGKATEWVIEQAWAIIQGRYQAERPLVLTSNYTLGELAERIGGIDGKRIASRLAEMCVRVEVKARDYRLHGGGGA